MFTKRLPDPEITVISNISPDTTCPGSRPDLTESALFRRIILAQCTALCAVGRVGCDHDTSLYFYAFELCKETNKDARVLVLCLYQITSALYCSRVHACLPTFCDHEIKCFLILFVFPTATCPFLNIWRSNVKIKTTPGHLLQHPQVYLK